MIFTELVDLCLLAVNGGQFTPEGAVQRPDVESYVPQAAHAVIRNAVFGLKVDERADRAQSGATAVAIDPGFFEVYELSLTEDSDRQMRYADLPGVVQSWPRDAALDVVYSKRHPVATYIKLQGPAEMSALGDVADVLNVFWHEVYNGTSTVTRLWFPGLGDGACNVLVRCAVEISPALGDTRVPLPVGLEALVAQMAVEHFRGQRSMPADPTINNQDVNAMAPQTSNAA